MKLDHAWALEKMPELLRICTLAGDAIMKIYQEDFVVMIKADSMPVTKADQEAEAIIIPALAAIAPHWTIVAEEDSSENGAPIHISNPFWLVDPLDGTREFMSRNGEFTVNIGLIKDKKPFLGVIYAPALGVSYYGIVGLGAWRVEDKDRSTPKAIFAKEPSNAGHIMISSRRHGDLKNQDDLLGSIKIKERINTGSSLKFCLIAEGKGDIYPRLGRTMEWDTAAGQAILEAAGGEVTTLEGEVFSYQKQADFANPSFLAWGKR